VNLLCVEYTGGRADGTTYDGTRPFARPVILRLRIRKVTVACLPANRPLTVDMSKLSGPVRTQ
jgi:hypothetical protein